MDWLTGIATIAALLGILTAVLTGIRKMFLVVDGYIARRITWALREALSEWTEKWTETLNENYVGRREYEVHKEHDTEMHVRLDGEVDKLWSYVNVHAKAAKQ